MSLLLVHHPIFCMEIVLNIWYFVCILKVNTYDTQKGVSFLPWIYVIGIVIEISIYVYPVIYVALYVTMYFCDSYCPPPHIGFTVTLPFRVLCLSFIYVLFSVLLLCEKLPALHISIHIWMLSKGGISINRSLMLYY